ncbi:MAG: abortive infection family protein [Deltaproteobacteria bacterium]|nr:abortive infection family protein [Deltaproteobacteria bacterium]
MEISEFTIQKLSKILNGDSGHTPYLSGSKLVDLFHQFGERDVYGQGFPSRWQYVEDKLRKFNGSTKLARLIESVVDPRNFFASELDIDLAVAQINELLSFDGYSLVSKRKGFKISNTDGVVIESESLAEIENDFVSEQIKKCDDKIIAEDFDGAITNARTLAETVMVDMLKLYEPEYKHKGDLTKAYNRIKAVLNLSPNISDYPGSIKQILSGLNSIVNGLATMRNEMSDAHAIRYKPEKHHAKLAVNASKTLCEFLIDALRKQTNRRKK